MAALLIDGGHTAVVVLDDEADTRGWINERILASAYERAASMGEGHRPRICCAGCDGRARAQCPADIPLGAAVSIMADLGVDHLFFLHHAAGRTWPASVLSLRDVVKALAGPDYLKNQGMHAARPTPMDLFRQRYGLAKTR